MPRTRLHILCVIIAVAMVVGGVMAAAAFGGFESPKKESTGKGESYGLGLEAGGATVLCGSGTTKLAWTIEQAGKATTKGADLLVAIEKQGECIAESGELASTKATVSECKLESQEPNAEEAISGRITNNCIVTAGTCEIKLEGKENEHLEHLKLNAGGVENENVFLEPLISDVTTTTKGTCPGIKGTKEGRLFGDTEADSVRAAPHPEFTITVTPRRFTAGKENGTVKVTYTGAGEQRPSAWRRTLELPGIFAAISPVEEELCEAKTYATGEKCEFKIEWNGISARLGTWKVMDEDGLWAKAEATSPGFS